MNVKKIGRKVIFSCILGMIVAFCYVGGKILDIYDAIDFYSKSFYIKWLGASVPTTIIIYLFFCFLQFLQEKQYFIIEQSEEYKKTDKLMLFGGTVFLLMCWLPAFFSIFPGAFSYDAYDEWMQVKNGTITAHHPVLHVLLLGGLVEGVYSLMGSYNVGIAIYTLAQMAILAMTLSYSVCFFKVTDRKNT